MTTFANHEEHWRAIQANYGFWTVERQQAIRGASGLLGPTDSPDWDIEGPIRAVMFSREHPDKSLDEMYGEMVETFYTLKDDLQRLDEDPPQE
jgi:hypothetical protein